MPRNKITSPTNQHVKQIVNLRERKARDESGLTVVEGYREILRAYEGGVLFQEVYVCLDMLKSSDAKPIEELVKKIEEHKISVHETTKNVFAKMAYGNRQEGVLSVCKPKTLTLDDLKLNKEALVVAAEGIEKPGNLGAILRTCDGAGVDALFVCEETTDIYNPNVIRSSLGTIFSVPVVSCTNEEAMDYFGKKNFKVCAAAPNAEVIYTQVDLLGPLAIAVGCEQKGLSDFWTYQSDVLVRIPMEGRADSLNVSVTAAVLVFEAVRQRANKTEEGQE